MWVALFTVHLSRRAVRPMGLTLHFSEVLIHVFYASLREKMFLCEERKIKTKQNRESGRANKKKQIKKKRKPKQMQNRKIRFNLRHKCFWRICWKYQKHYQYIRYMKYHTWLNPGICLENWIVSPEPLRIPQL